MSELRDLENKYLRDTEFCTLVNMLYHFMIDNKITPLEIREATFLAGIKLHQHSSKPNFIHKDICKCSKCNGFKD